MAALLRYGGRRSQATRLLSPFCPGSISRFCASDGSAGRGRGRGSDDLVPNPFEPPAPGSAPSSVSQGSGRGKKSSFAERLGVNFEPPVREILGGVLNCWFMVYGINPKMCNNKECAVLLVCLVSWLVFLGGRVVIA